MSEMWVKVRTLTPLWTGGVSGTTDRLHETGILGSLRWWGEVILRSLGGSACDPSRHDCPDRDGSYCDACALYGATGLKRSFYIDWDPKRNPNPDERLEIKVQNNRGWYLSRGLFFGDLVGTLSITNPPAGVSPQELLQFLTLSLCLASEWGGIGARTQQGYGVVHVVTEPELDLSQALNAITKLQSRSKRQGSAGRGLPRLDEFFFVKVRFKLEEDPKKFIENRTTKADKLEWYIDNKILPLAPIVRYYLRQLIRQQIQYNGNPNALARWRLMGVVEARYHPVDFGKVEPIAWQCQRCHQKWTGYKPSKHQKDRKRELCKGRVVESQWQCTNCNHTWNDLQVLRQETQRVERLRSLIHVSHAYPVGNDRYEFRILGWIPQELPGNVRRDSVLGKLRQWLGVSDPTAPSFQTASGGTLWGTSYVDLKGPSVLWRESPSVEDLVAGDEGAIP